MATKRKVEVMSEDREVNGEGENGQDWLTFVLEGPEGGDFDITVRLRPDYFIGCDPASVFTLANRDGYNHVFSNEKSAAGTRFMKSNPNATAQERADFENKWLAEKRDEIISGEYSRGGRGGPRGPRLSPVEQEHRDLLNGAIMELWLKSGKERKDFPKKQTDTINGFSVADWRIKLAAHPDYAHLLDEARANVAKREAKEAEAIAASKSAPQMDAFAAYT